MKSHVLLGMLLKTNFPLGKGVTIHDVLIAVFFPLSLPLLSRRHLGTAQVNYTRSNIPTATLILYRMHTMEIQLHVGIPSDSLIF